MITPGIDYWLRLDNAAKIYPPVMNSEQTTIFRLSVSLDHRIKIEKLKAAVETATIRFPYFNVSLTRGFFWYFLEYTGNGPRIHPDIGPICTPFANKRKGEPLFRIMVRDNRISVEFMHILTDGGGGMEYLKFLLTKYLDADDTGILPLDLAIETEDSYSKNFNPEIPPSPILSTAWHLPFDLAEKPRLRTLTAEFNTLPVLDLAKSMGISITEYLTSIYLFTLQEIWSEEKKRGFKSRRPIIRVQVPMNLRQRYDSGTMRNFSLFVTPELDTRLGWFSFEDVVKTVHQYMLTHLDNRYINRIINRNVRSEKNPVIRVLPLFIKVFALKLAYKRHGARKYSGVITNLGNITLQEDINQHVEGFEIYPPPPAQALKTSCGVAGYNNVMRLTFTTVTPSRRLERGIIGHLIDRNVKVKIINP